MILSPIPDEYPNPDCPACGGEGRPKTKAYQILADGWSNEACLKCWENEENNDDR